MMTASVIDNLKDESTSRSPSFLGSNQRVLLCLSMFCFGCLYVTTCPLVAFSLERSAQLKSDGGPDNIASSSSGAATPVRLLVVSITGTSKLQEAIHIEDSWKQFLGPNDVIRTVCDQGCASRIADTLNTTTNQNSNTNIVELDSQLINSIRRPWQFESEQNSWGYRLAQLKFYFGLISQVQQFVADPQYELPQWILIKDDDGYVHADHLMQLVEGVDYTKEKVSMAGGFPGRKVELLYPPGDHLYGPPQGCHWPSGGSGWLLSRTMALELAVNQPDRVYAFMRHKLEQSEYAFHYDIWLPEIASWGGGRLYHSPAMYHLFPGLIDCYDNNTGTNAFASIHMKDFVKYYGLEGALTRLEDCMKRPFVPSELLRDRIEETKQQRTSRQYCPVREPALTTAQ